jgi:ethanolamine utilization protein EutN
MFLGKVIGDIDSNEDASEGNRRLKMVQKLDLYRNPSGPSTIAVDFIGAGDGDIVIVGDPSAGSNSIPRNTSEQLSSATIMGILDNSHSKGVRREAAR